MNKASSDQHDLGDHEAGTELAGTELAGTERIWLGQIWLEWIRLGLIGRVLGGIDWIPDHTRCGIWYLDVTADNPI